MFLGWMIFILTYVPTYMYNFAVVCDYKIIIFIHQWNTCLTPSWHQSERNPKGQSRMEKKRTHMQNWTKDTERWQTN